MAGRLVRLGGMAGRLVRLGGMKAVEAGRMLLRMVRAADVFGWNAVVVGDVQKH